MALVFDADNERVEVAAAASIDDFSALTVLAWLNPSAFTTARIWSKGGTSRKRILFTAAGLGAVRLLVDRATTDADTTTANNILPTGTWSCLGATYDETNGWSVYTGTLAAAMAEVTYASEAAGSGATVADSAFAMCWANNAEATTQEFYGSLAYGAYFPRVLTLAEMQSWQLNPRPMIGATKAGSFHEFGLTGVGSQIDYTGNGNTGTITGATQGAHVVRRWMSRMAA